MRLPRGEERGHNGRVRTAWDTGEQGGQHMEASGASAGHAHVEYQ